MRLEYQDSIDRYLLGRMSDEERALFEAKCAENTELKEQLEHTQDVKAVISERSKMLERIQGWDEEYNEKKKATTRMRRIKIYWSSGVAAALVVGYILYPFTNSLISDPPESFMSLNKDSRDIITDSKDLDSCVDTKLPELLLAQNNNHDEITKENVSKQNEFQIHSFEKSGLETTSSPKQSKTDDELKQIDEKSNAINKDIEQLFQQLNKGEINQEFYDSYIGLLKYQRDYLSWRKVKLLIELGHRNEALEILNEMRSEDGAFSCKADSLYHEVK